MRNTTTIHTSQPEPRKGDTDNALTTLLIVIKYKRIRHFSCMAISINFPCINEDMAGLLAAAAGWLLWTS